MIILKKYIFKIALILGLLISVFLCSYTIRNYKANTSNVTQQSNSFKNNVSQPPNGAKTNSQLPPNGNMQGGNSKTDTTYAPMITAYSAIFIIVFIAGYYFFIYRKTRINAYNGTILIGGLLLIGFFLRISIAALINGYSSDINLFKSWATAASNNFLQVYSNSGSSDYPPLYMYILFLIGKIASISVINPYFTLLLKLPSIIADILTSLIIYKFARKHLSLEISILLSAFYIFNPAIFINSSIWGQVDSFFTLIVVSAIFMLSENKIGTSAALFMSAVLMKPQGIIFLPVIFFELVRQRNLKSFLKASVFAVVTALIVIVPFSFNQSPLWIFKLYSSTVGEYPYASVNAFNFFTLIGKNYTKDTSTMFLFSYHTWGMIFIIMVTAFTWLIYVKGNNKKFASAI